MIVQTLCYTLTHDESALWARLEWYAQQEGIKLTEQKNVEKTASADSSEAPVLKISRLRTSVLWQGKELFFHPGMALLRLMGELRGEKDRYLRAAALKSGDICIDATMGLAGDALMAAWKVGEKGRVLALEASPLLAALTKEGLRHMSQSALPSARGLKGKAWEHLRQASGRIEIHLCDHLNYLSAQRSNSFDVICFDPMFRQTRDQSSSMRPLKPWIHPEPLKREAVREACRTARRVVLKERTGSTEFARLGFTIIPGGRYSPIAFGLIRRGNSSRCFPAEKDDTI